MITSRDLITESSHPRILPSLWLPDSEIPWLNPWILKSQYSCLIISWYSNHIIESQDIIILKESQNHWIPTPEKIKKIYITYRYASAVRILKSHNHSTIPRFQDYRIIIWSHDYALEVMLNVMTSASWNLKIMVFQDFIIPGLSRSNGILPS